MLVLFPLLLLLPVVTSDCFNARVRLLCGSEYYKGPVVVNLWDDNFFLFGGDKRIMARDYTVKDGKTIEIRDAREDCWFFEPYIKFTSYCKKDHGINVFKQWYAYFRRKFFTDKNTLIFSACRKVASDNTADVTIQLADEDEC